MNGRQLSMLRHIAHSPRARDAFTGSGSMGLSSRIAQTYLDEMQDQGYIECDERGTYSATPLGLAYLDSHRETAPSRLIGNWSTEPGSYRASPLQSTRPGADDHRQYRSRGF
jgi:DNA-binding PadR family transcriptional regulator